VRLIATNDHSSDTLVKLDYISVGTVSLSDNFENDLAIYPNPASSYFFLETDENIDNIEIYSNTGELCKSIKPGSSGDKTKVDISYLSSGIYFVKIISGQNTSVNKLVKK